MNYLIPYMMTTQTELLVQLFCLSSAPNYHSFLIPNPIDSMFLVGIEFTYAL